MAERRIETRRGGVESGSCYIDAWQSRGILDFAKNIFDIY
jgi:hypothetical protein